jgi:hypothetical protein
LSKNKRKNKKETEDITKRKTKPLYIRQKKKKTHYVVGQDMRATTHARIKKQTNKQTNNLTTE